MDHIRRLRCKQAAESRDRELLTLLPNVAACVDVHVRLEHGNLNVLFFWQCACTDDQICQLTHQAQQPRRNTDCEGASWIISVSFQWPPGPEHRRFPSRPPRFSRKVSDLDRQPY